ncbi:MAG: sensor histidine kinase [Acidimicrobiia bacterium]
MPVLLLILGLAVGTLVGAVAMRRLVARREPIPVTDRQPPLSFDASAELARLRVALDALPVGVVLADASGAIVFRNAVSEHIAGSRHADVLVEEAIDSLAAGAINGRARSQTLDLFGPPRRTLLLRADPIDGGEGGVLLTVADETDRSRLDAVRTDFVANVSHELKTPVGAMTVLADAIADAGEPEVVERLAGRIVDEAERLSRTIDDLLELSRIELGGQAISEPVCVDLVIAEAVGRVRSLAARRGIVLGISDVPATLEILGDRRQVVSALGNLVENAVKYSEAGGAVDIGATLVDGWIELSVVDHGIGIPARDLDRVFERFYRVDRARSRETGGTGLGLSIVRHVAANHGGDVRVSSIEGEGSTFVLRVPATSRTTQRAIDTTLEGTCETTIHRATHCETER